ncbi:cysteine desulfurase-like protein [Nocardioides sp. Soil805]|uniref:cysteine desulfurase-like protein n=1 Tax=Nocardioides sp. Soil805 TaxID=1736416 RepID=UPI001F260CB4|nr:cysteine desulfurase-like protein [Nocardioides sp. Soil805]
MTTTPPTTADITSAYDVADLRSAFPGLDPALARFDGPGGSLVPAAVADAVADMLRAGVCQRGGPTAVGRLADETVLAARAAIARFVGLADPRGVVFGRSMTAVTFDMARTLAQDWGPGDEVVVTRLDHDANIRPWVVAAERAGATVRWLGFDPVTAELDDVAPLLTERTRLVAVTAASNLFGTRPDVAGIARAAHEVGALVHVDAVHLAAHVPVDLEALGADLLACSPYKFFGPHLGALAADPALLERLRPDKLLPSSDAVPERFELGTLPYELLAGVTAAVEFAESWSMAAVEEHERTLLTRLLDGLGAIEAVTVHGRPARRTPTVLVGVDGLAPAEVSRRLAERGVAAPAGSFYALEASRHAGLGDEGGVRIGLAAYTTAGEVDLLLEAIEAVAGE